MTKISKEDLIAKFNNDNINVYDIYSITADLYIYLEENNLKKYKNNILLGNELYNQYSSNGFQGVWFSIYNILNKNNLKIDIFFNFIKELGFKEVINDLEISYRNRLILENINYIVNEIEENPDTDEIEFNEISDEEFEILSDKIMDIKSEDFKNLNEDESTIKFRELIEDGDEIDKISDLFINLIELDEKKYDYLNTHKAFFNYCKNNLTKILGDLD